MRWTPGKRNENLEDRRGESGGGGFGGGGGGGMRLGLGGTVVVLVLSLIFGKDFFSMVDGGADPTSGQLSPQTGAPVASSASEDRNVEFANFMLNDTEQTWSEIFAAAGGRPYQDPKLVLFRDGVESACGFAQAATGPFYCPGDKKVYIDLGFFDELSKRFGAPGDFARAYVLAHEFGHHVQNLMGTEQELRRAQQANPQSANELSVAMELQADCYAGIWAASANRRNILEPGDVEGGLKAAAAVGDDRLQRMGQGYVNPESFTHGSSAQRMQWFQRGYTEGKVSACYTFGR